MDMEMATEKVVFYLWIDTFKCLCLYVKW